MRIEISNEAKLAWVRKGLPGRIGVHEVAKELGFVESDIQILMSTGRLVPLGNPAPNAPKWFSSLLVVELSMRPDWLNHASIEVYGHGQKKRARLKPKQRSSPKSSPIEMKVEQVDKSLQSNSTPQRTA